LVLGFSNNKAIILWAIFHTLLEQLLSTACLFLKFSLKCDPNMLQNCFMLWEHGFKTK
jgi:competence transcription factor ComK